MARKKFATPVGLLGIFLNFNLPRSWLLGDSLFERKKRERNEEKEGHHVGRARYIILFLQCKVLYIRSTRNLDKLNDTVIHTLALLIVLPPLLRLKYYGMPTTWLVIIN